MKKLFFILLAIPCVALSAPETGNIRLSSAQQGIDGTCDWGYDASTTDAIDTVTKYMGRIAPWAECGPEVDAFYAADADFKSQVYLSILDLPPTHLANWATVGDYLGSRRLGWMRNFADTLDAFTWTTADEKEKFHMHFFDDTRMVMIGGQDPLKDAVSASATNIRIVNVGGFHVGDSIAIFGNDTDYVEITGINTGDTSLDFTPALTFAHSVSDQVWEYRFIPGAGHDSASIVAGDSVSRVPNKYANAPSGWNGPGDGSGNGNTYATGTRLLPNLTSPEVRKSVLEYSGMACTTLTGASMNFWPGKTEEFDGIFFDNAADIALGCMVITGGHIIESFNVSIGAIGSNVDSMTVSAATRGSHVVANRTPWDIWWWDNSMKPFLMAFDTLLDSIEILTGTRKRYMLNSGFIDQIDTHHDPDLGPHDLLLEWGGTGGLGHTNSGYNASGSFMFGVDSQYTKDSICAVRGNTRVNWTRQPHGTFTGSVDTSPSSSGGGTQNWHEGWIFSYMWNLLMHGDSTYYDLWDKHSAYFGETVSAGSSEFDSLHFGSQGTFDFRTILLKNIGTKQGLRPLVLDTGTIGGDFYEVWFRDYDGFGAFPNTWRVLFVERDTIGSNFMSSSTPATIPLGSTWFLYGDDYAKDSTAADTLNGWGDSLSTGTFSEIFLRQGEAVILYSTIADITDKRMKVQK